MFKNKTVLITGGTGSFGKHFTKLLLNKYKPKKVLIFSRDELKQFEMQNNSHFQKFEKKIRYFIGDVRDADRLKFAFMNVDYVVHAAALKQVPSAEYNPFEVVKTNIHGAQNVIDAALQCNVKKVIALSTDKAAAPVNLYGATKLTSDKMFVTANNYTNSKIKFSVVRYGNVFASRGSVVPFFLSLKNKSKYFPITDLKMTRFNITLNQASNFVINCFDKMWGGEIFVPKAPSYRIVDLAKAIDKNKKLQIVGIRPGEKIHEELITKSDSHNVIEFKNYYIILPNSLFLDWNKKTYLKKFSGKVYPKLVKKGFEYTSGENKQFLTNSSLVNLVKLLK